MILQYGHTLKAISRKLRKEMTEPEIILWSRLCQRKIAGIQFYRQKPIGNYIVDFYAPKINLVVELDGSQHYEHNNKINDEIRDVLLSTLHLTVLRFSNEQIFCDLDAVVAHIYNYAKETIKS